MSRFDDVMLDIAAQPTATEAPIPFAGIEPGELASDPLLGFNPTTHALHIPLLTADPAGNPPANSVYLYAVLDSGNYSIRLKIPAGTVKTTGTLS